MDDVWELILQIISKGVPPMDEEQDPCPDCDRAGCSTCDGTPLTDEEVDEQKGE